ncbi:DUF3644 domain-containing protein [Faecalibaculum rodentium]|uniref:DUF3644 domain-containing protein n=1 Tax=Faecalibaculum rodentium TaxID=1702221 RepID=UPI002573A07A|nr:DUF3644 domain-containing protein [Faecalibaculum rodentium]
MTENINSESKNKSYDEKLTSLLISKSLESFILGLEIFNKPTIKYRVEGFSFFICNAWELMLKAELIKRGISIYYKGSDRTLALSDTIKKIYTDEKTRIRLNLEEIIDLRNTSTHFVTEEYELKYIPLFQSNVFNFENEMKKRHGIDITDYLPENFLALTGHVKPLSDDEIRIKYPAEIAEKLIRKSAALEGMAEQYNSDTFSMSVKQNLYITKKRNEADFAVSIQNGTGTNVQIVKEMKDPANTHPYNFKEVIKLIKDEMSRKSLRIDNNTGFTSAVLAAFINFYHIKEDSKYAYMHQLGKTPQYSYSKRLVDFVIDEIAKNPENFYHSLKNAKKR